jgi:hypothetical protein
VAIVLADVERVLAQDDPEVVLGFGEVAVRVDELESAPLFPRVPLIGVAVNRGRPFVAMRLGAADVNSWRSSMVTPRKPRRSLPVRGTMRAAQGIPHEPLVMPPESRPLRI